MTKGSSPLREGEVGLARFQTGESSETKVGFVAVSPTVVRLHVNRAHRYGGEIASVNPLHGPNHQYPGITIFARLGLHSVLNHLKERISHAVTREP